MKYRNRGRISLEYDRGRLTRAVDSAGRSVVFKSTPEGRIASISVPNPLGAEIVFARYQHDARGDLVAVTDADGNVTRYHYDGEHRLVRLDYPSGLSFHFRYDSANRCCETWGAYPNGRDPALSDSTPGFLVDGVTRAKGIYHCRFDYDGDGFSEVVDSVRTQRFFAGPGDQIAKAVGATGGVTTRTFDAEDRIESVTDPTGATWLYQYDDLGNVTRETDPEGNSVVVERDGAGRPIAFVDPGGGRTSIDRDDAGEVIFTHDPIGGQRQFVRDDRGLATQVIDERGAAQTFEFDAQGNCVARVMQNGGRFEFEYDYWGRCVREVNPLGAESRFAYSPGGKLIQSTDPVGENTSYSYDNMGNLLSVQRGAQPALRRFYGGLNWLCRVEFPDGAQQVALHNLEGWPVSIENERGERHTFAHYADGMIAQETNFHGQGTRFGYDALGRLTWWDDGRGKTLLTLSPTGRVLQEEAPDGSLRSYTYSARGDLVRAASGNTEFEWQRDAAGNVLREALVVEGVSYSIESERQAAGDRSGYRTSLGLDVEVERGVDGRVTALRTDETRLLTVTRNQLGLPVRREFAEGGVQLDEYTPLNQLECRRVLPAGTAAPNLDEPAWLRQAPSQLEVRYAYTQVGEIERVTTNGTFTELQYDTRRHLRERTEGARSERFEVDPASNYAEAGPDAKARVYGRGNQLLAHGEISYKYDERGYLVEKTRKVEGLGEPEQTFYEWNAWNLLAAIRLPDGGRVEFDYDAFARRYAKRVFQDGRLVARHHYVWDLVSMIHDVDALELGEPRLERTYLFEDNDRGVPIAHQEPRGWVYYVLDPVGWPEHLVSADGKPLARMAHSAFGALLPTANGGVTTQFRFPGQYADLETGLHYNRYRYYDPQIGRYLSPDPIGIDGGLNLYAYGPNPVGWSDPMGWKHKMEIEEAPEAFTNWVKENGHTHQGGDSYLSGTKKTTRCPQELDNDSSCHTEQKFAHDLIKAHQDGVVKSGDKFTLKGQYPPCPVCHTAMMRAAQETGTEVNYRWEQPPGTWQSVKYTGGTNEAGGKTVSVSGDGEFGKRVANYNTKQQGTYWADDDDKIKSHNKWGYKTDRAARAEYNAIMQAGGWKPSDADGGSE